MTVGKSLTRLQDAIARHGAQTLAGRVWRTIGRLGWRGAFRLAREDRPFLSVELDPVRATGARAASSAGLDADRTIPDAAWRRWLNRRLAPVRTVPAAPIVVWRQGDPNPFAGTAPEPDLLCVLLKAGDEPRPELLAALAAAPKAAQVITFDLYRKADEAIEPLFLPGANPAMLTQWDYLFSRAAVRAGLLPGSGIGAHGAVRQAILDWCAERPVRDVRAGWVHIGLPLVQAAITDEEKAVSIPCTPSVRPSGPGKPEPVSVVLCTRDKGHLTRQLCRSLLADEAVGQLVIVSNGTRNPYALQTLADLAAHPRATVVRRDEPFNFSRLCNAGVRETRLEGPLLFINDDVAPVTGDWLAALSAPLQDLDVGAVGALLLYPDERVQHAGMYLRQKGGAGHLLRFARLPDDDYLGLAATTREVAAVTGAALLTRRTDFEAVGGFDEALAISLQDVDYCLKLRQLDRRIIFEPRAVLLHMESTSLQDVLASPAVARQRHQDHQRFMARWKAEVAADPFHSACFDPEDESLHRLAKR